VVIDLGDGHLRQQACCRDALVDHLRGHRCGLDRLAARAGVFATNVAQHEELGRHAVELLADLFADAFEGLTTGAVRGGDVVVAINARQVGGQRLAHGFALGSGRCRRRLGALLGGLVLQRGIAQDGIEQHGLRAAVDALGRSAEAPALQARDLEVQCFVPGLLELDLGLHALNQISQHLQRLVGVRGARRGLRCE
jgi:hypothetical protein